jgi:S-adenosylmethionine decarboxylase
MQAQQQVQSDHFIFEDGKYFAGHHYIIDLYGTDEAANRSLIEALLPKMVAVAGATLLHSHIHEFTPSGGLSGVAVLAESHISFHTWPERNFASFDIFMCGKAKPQLAAELLIQTLKPKKTTQTCHQRGNEINDF